MAIKISSTKNSIVDDAGVLKLEQFTLPSTDGTSGQVLQTNGAGVLSFTSVGDATAHIADSTIHFTEASIDHANILNIGTNTHAQIDTHIADATVHRTINDLGATTVDLWSASKITSELNLKSDTTHNHAGVYEPANANIQSHIADLTLHRVINDAGTSATELWSASKISSELALKPSDLSGLSDTTITLAAKGDLLVHNGTAWVDVGVGTNDQVLTADSTQAAGVKWATAAGGGGGASFAVGTMIEGPSAPTGDGTWIQCDGSAVSQTTYSSLYAQLGHTYLNFDENRIVNVADAPLASSAKVTAIPCGSNIYLHYDGTDDGFISSNDGVSWSASTFPLNKNVTVHDMVSDGTSKIVMCNDNASYNPFYYSADSGATWTESTYSTDGQWSLAYGDSRFAANLVTNTTSGQARFLISADGGATWSGVINSSTVYNYVGMNYDPDTSYWYAFFEGDGTGSSGGAPKLLRSTTANYTSSTWDEYSFNDNYPFSYDITSAAFVSNGRLIVMGAGLGSSDAAIWYTDDPTNGTTATWKKAIHPDGLQVQVYTPTDEPQLMRAFKGGIILYTDATMLFSYDDGATWNILDATKTELGEFMGVAGDTVVVTDNASHVGINKVNTNTSTNFVLPKQTSPSKRWIKT